MENVIRGTKNKKVETKHLSRINAVQSMANTDSWHFEIKLLTSMIFWSIPESKLMKTNLILSPPLLFAMF